MQDKTIKSILKKKMNDWVNNVDDIDIKTIIKNKTIITGGAIVSLFNNEEPKDYDVYVKDKESAKKIAQYYVDKFNNAHPDTKAEVKEEEQDRIKIYIASRGVASEDENILEEPFEDAVDVIQEADEIPADKLEGDEKEKYRPVFLSSNAITLSDKIQIVVRFYGDAETIHSTYDFLHCTSWYDTKEGTLNYTPECLRSIMDKQLIYMGSKYPVCSIIRLRKFIKRGWHVNAGQILKALFQVSQLDLTNIKVLEDQLVGVDSAYFMMLIDALKKKIDKDEDFVINEGYLISIIDKIF